MDRNTFIEKALKVKENIVKAGGKICSFDIGEPISHEQINKLQELYNLQFPTDFVDMCTSVAGRVDISWSLYNDRGKELNKRLSFIEKTRQIYSGELRWNIELYFSEYEKKLYQNPNNDPELIGKLHLFDVSNGAMIMFDVLKPGLKKPVIYLGHDDYFEGPQQLAQSFDEYVSSLLDIGLVGSEIEQTGYFINRISGCIDPSLPDAQEWRQLIGLA